MNKLILLYIIFSYCVWAQKSYYVIKDGSGDFSSIKELNSANISSGDLVFFKSGQEFSDAVLICDNGVTYDSYGGNDKAKIGNPTKIEFESTIDIYEEDVTLQNLEIFGYKNSNRTIRYTAGGLTIDNCVITGSDNAHSYQAIGIKCETNELLTRPIKITNNIIREFDKGMYIISPFNMEIAYNTIYNMYRTNGSKGKGGQGIQFHLSTFDKSAFDSKYTLHIHHNEIYNFEHSAIYTGPISRALIEYNYVHDNLDERIYRGGIANGSFAKLIDSHGMTMCNLGIVVRYNYLKNFIKHGARGYDYTNANASKGTYDSTYTGNTIPTYDGVEASGNIFGGGGYGNDWIHNNIIQNTNMVVKSKGFFFYLNGLGTTLSKDPNAVLADYSEIHGSYFVNNTLLQIGDDNSYLTDQKGYTYIEETSQSPHSVYNNIIDFRNTFAKMAAYFKEEKNASDYNIYTLRGGSSRDVKQFNSSIATCFVNYENFASGEGEQGFTDPNWVDTSATIYAFDVGVNGNKKVYIPDVRIRANGNAHDKGMDYDIIGDTYTVLGQRHEIGKDPTGRSFAYDILGNYRSTNDIGAVGTAEGVIIDDNPTTSSAPVITEQPSNVSIALGSDVTLSVSAICDDEIGYQWWKSPYISESESKILNNEKYSGATTNTLKISNVTTEDASIEYICEVYNKKDHSNLWINTEPASIVITQSQGSSGNNNLKVFLESPFNNGRMNTVLYSEKLFPKTQPYKASPWNFESNVELNEIKSNYVDWLLVELRKEIDYTTYSKLGVLTQNGTIINEDGSRFSFSDIEDGEYFIAIKHRNHLSIMSSVKVTVNKNKPIIYDFTNSQNSAYGNRAMAELGNDIFGMFAGDADANGTINNLDFGSVANTIPYKGYHNFDLDLNGRVNILDYNKINKNILKRTQIPN